ncbi:50S ribosomal protein L4 [Patescibacteria group bacterium]|nr:50S ribosomal protein L4 [Patescibacteria group bacterium]
MPKVKVYNLKGEEVKEEELDPKFFNIKIKPAVVQQVVEAQLANSRQVLAHTKGRSEVRGGGRKPWKQKGTGRARHGSIRSPLWKGGGVTFGPTKERNFSKAVNKKVKKKAVQMVLADKANNNKLILVEGLQLDAAKTKKLVEILNKLPIKNKKVLIALVKKSDSVIRSAKNLPQVETLPAASLNVVDLLNYPYLLMPVAAIKKVIETYS